MTYRTGTYQITSASEFNRRINEGLRRAPYERAKAIREMWGWITRR